MLAWAWVFGFVCLPVWNLGEGVGFSRGLCLHVKSCECNHELVVGVTLNAFPAYTRVSLMKSSRTIFGHPLSRQDREEAEAIAKDKAKKEKTLLMIDE